MAASKTKKRKPTKEEKARIKAEAERVQQELARKKEIHDEIISVIIIAIGIFFVLSLHTASTGAVGQVVQSVLFGLFGRIAYVLPYYLIIYGILNFAQKTSYISFRSVIFAILLFFFISTINASFFDQIETYTWSAIKDLYLLGKTDAGVIGVLINTLLSKVVGRTGLYIICAAGIIVCLLFIIDTPISALFDSIKIKARAKREAAEATMAESEEQVTVEDIQDEIDRQGKINEVKGIEAIKQIETEFEKPNAVLAAPSSDTLPKLNISFDNVGENVIDIDSDYFEEDTQQALDNKQQILKYVNDDNLFDKKESSKSSSLGLATSGAENQNSDRLFPDENYAIHKEGMKYKFPPLSLLGKGKLGKNSATNLHSRAQALEDTLKSFGVDAEVSDVVQGPAVTRFEVTPAPGVKVSKITNLHDDIALNLRAKSLRIEAPIPGKAAVGIEVANDEQTTVPIREIIESKAFTSAKSKISMGLGKAISGEPIIANLKDMPHLLIAGSTGSGKSVCINSIIMSFLYKATPEEVKLILIDPKVVELSIYNGIPHLLVPVVTEANKASAALGWAVSEMDARYRKFADENVRDITSYNESVIANDEKEKILPQIVIIIDELHDLMMVAQNQVETYISRLAAKARAAGIYLIIATQRPSVNVITGTIKANIPSRIAFAVSSQVDSRTIIDMGGAEHLIGKGDMLYSPQGIDKPMRVQGCFVSDEEVLKVIEFVKKNSGTAEYSNTVAEALEKSQASSTGSDNDSGDDELYDEAVQFIVSAGQASVSSLQRRFRIGYNRAARIIDIMEEKGVVGPADGGRPRKVLITDADLH